MRSEAAIPAWFMAGTEGGIVYIVLSLMMLFAHRKDFTRIRRGEEEQIDVPALIKKKFFSK